MKTTKKIDLNADLGEYTTEDKFQNEIFLKWNIEKYTFVAFLK